MNSSISTSPPRLIDSTLRDGEQAPGVSFSRKEKLKLAHLLNVIGVDEIEAGTPAMGAEEVTNIRAISRANLDCRISVWSRALRNDIEMSARTEAQGIHIAFPISDIQLRTINKDWMWVCDVLPELVEYARRYFPFVSVGAQDASRTKHEQLYQYMSLVQQADVTRVRIADTVGLFTPVSLYHLISQLKVDFPSIELDFHGHNDLGMATANAITAWQAGAENVSVTVNGLGERAGNSPLEEVVMSLQSIFHVSHFKTQNISQLCNYVAEISQRSIPVNNPITGNFAFSHESGIHAKGTLTNPTAFQPFDGQMVGREAGCNVFGKHSGRAAIIHFFNQRNIFPTEDDIAFIVKKVQALSIQHKRIVSTSEMLTVYDELYHR